MVNELIENECLTNTFDFNHGFIESNDRNNESFEYSKSLVHEFVEKNNAKCIGNQLERNNILGLTRTCGSLYAAKRTSERNNRRRQKRALQKGMHTANCKTSSTTDLCKNKSSLKYFDNN
ncbi:unnamed protein product [Rotaria magnacalcarata]|nr:unnamed protein product [Rotaria magnacalcarata]CAF1616992.1 unnamed protein product [Rotaria magnacalcarata]CAF2106747.1 unnamed protein product [Rotaria magnacalcarata]CAF2160686.1 unnamed protein product [Rotaria magnacalcarata]CAF2176853.1 unnamed protein product [Rotaria magnacalcarata]